MQRKINSSEYFIKIRSVVIESSFCTREQKCKCNSFELDTPALDQMSNIFGKRNKYDKQEKRMILT